MKRLLVTILCATLLVFGVELAVPFDQEPGGFKEFPAEKEYVDLRLSIVNVRTTGEATGIVSIFDKTKRGFVWEERKGMFDQRGVGTVMSDRYIVTAAHVVTPSSLTIQVSEGLFWHTDIARVLHRDIWIGDLEAGIRAFIFYIDIEHDIAVLEYHSPLFKPLPYEASRTFMLGPLGAESYIYEENAVAIIVRKRDGSSQPLPWFEVRYGKIISGGVVTDHEKDLPWFNMNDFTMDIALYPGDSGSPVFAFEGGVPVLIGVARAVSIWGTYSYATRIDFIKRILEQGQPVR